MYPPPLRLSSSSECCVVVDLLLMMIFGLGVGGDLVERVRKWVLEMMKFTTVEVEFGIVDF